MSRLAEAQRVYQIALEAWRCWPTEETDADLQLAKEELEAAYLESMPVRAEE